MADFGKLETQKAPSEMDLWCFIYLTMYICKYSKKWVCLLVLTLVFMTRDFSLLWAGERETLRIVGSTTVLPIASRAAEQFKALKGGTFRITVNAGGSGVGVNSVAGRRADIGMISRELSDGERRRFRDSHLTLHQVARDGVVCAVSSEVYEGGVRALTKQQISDIYRGRLTNWQEVGGPDRRIVVVDKERHRGTRHVFMKYILGNATARAPAARLVTGSNNEEQAKIAQSDGAIGMLSVAWLNEDVKGTGIREGDRVIEPTREHIVSGDFPMARSLVFLTAGEPKGLAREFIAFVLGPKGRRIIENSGYTPMPATTTAQVTTP